jgi:hypothetical protein
MLTPKLRLPAGTALMVLTALFATTARAAISDVIVWDSVKTQGNLQTSLNSSGYSSMTGMRLWWKMNSASNLGTDATGHGHTGIVKGVVSGLTMVDQFNVSRTVASGFNHDSCYIVGNPAFPNAVSSDRTYEMWIRNPAKNGSVFFSVTEDEAGGGDDIKRAWVNADGSITIADYGYVAPREQSFTTVPLEWVNNRWYQIAITWDGAAGSNTHTCKVYRGDRSTGVTTLLKTYTGSANPSVTTQWLAVGGHERGYYSTGSGKAGFLGCDGTGASPTITLEQFNAVGNGTADDTIPWRKATALLSAYGRGTLQLAAGKTYKVGKQDNGPWPNAPYYKAHGLGLVLGATAGNIIIDGAGSTIRMASGMKYGSFYPSSGAAYPNQTTDPQYGNTPGDLLKIEGCLNVEVRNITLYGNIENQTWGGLWSNLAGDTGIQLAQSGLKVVGNDAVWIHDVQIDRNGLDGIDVLNDDLDEFSELKTVLIERATCLYNGRQGLSYNCGNHLNVYDSVFSHTGKVAGKQNSPGAGVDLEPMGRYMAPGAFFQNCRFYNNTAAGALIVGAEGAIFRNCIMWGTTNFGVRIGMTSDADHLFVDSAIHGGIWTKGARIRLESCTIKNKTPDFYTTTYPNAIVANNHGIEQTGGSITASNCTIEAMQTAYSTWISNAVLQSSTVTHGNVRGNNTDGFVGRISGSLLWNTTFRETSAFASEPLSSYYIEDLGGSAKVASGVSIEGPTAGSDHYIAWSVPSSTHPITTNPIPADVPGGVLTPNAAAGETQINTGATYSVNVEAPFTNPGDSGSPGRLFDGDSPDDWSNAVGINWKDQVVTVDLKATRNVRSVKLRMKHAQRPLRVYVEVGNGSTWTPMGLIRPLENIALAPWYDVAAATPLAGRYVRLRFENEGLWGWYINEVKVYGY